MILNSSITACTPNLAGIGHGLLDGPRPAGYARWENFSKVIEKAVTSCSNAGYDQDDHFLEVTKKVDLGSGAVREILIEKRLAEVFLCPFLASLD
jgi:hypothetical protein